MEGAVVNVKREGFNEAELLKKAKERKENEAKKSKVDFVHASERVALKARKHDLLLEENVGKVSFGEENAGKWYCKDCDIAFNDNITYLDHINGKKHQRVVGVSVNRLEKVGATAVRSKFAELKKKKELTDAQKTMHIEDRLKRKQADWESEEAAKKVIKRESRKKKKEAVRLEGTSEVDEDAEMMAVMGFSGFK